MNNDVYDVLEACLQSLEHGAKIETLLANYPQFANELRPLLKIALSARAMPLTSPSASGMRRGRAQFLQKAAEMREAKVSHRSRPSVIPLFQRLAIALGLTSALVFSGTGLVSASSTALPGENLYPVKRTWEDVRLLFVFNVDSRDLLESQYDQERLHEATDLLAEGRQQEISFTGVVTKQNDQFYISGLPVLLTSDTKGVLEIGATVMAVGGTNAQGYVILATVETLPSGSMVPLGQLIKGDSDERDEFHMEGKIDSIKENSLIINGRVVYLENTKIEGTISVGAQADVEGYFTSDGRFIAVMIEVKDSSSGDGRINVNSNDNNSSDANSNGGNYGSDDSSPNSNSNKSDDGNKKGSGDSGSSNGGFGSDGGEGSSDSSGSSSFNGQGGSDGGGSGPDSGGGGSDGGDSGSSDSGD